MEGHYDPPWKMILGTTFEVKLTKKLCEIRPRGGEKNEM